MHLLLILSISFCSFVCVIEALESKQYFSVRPWTDQHVIANVGQYQCEFKWKAHGGSHEERWSITFSQDEATGTLLCDVVRDKHGKHGHSHFVGFTARIIGVKELKRAEIWDHTGVLLRDEAFSVSENQVQSLASWGKELDRVQLEA